MVDGFNKILSSLGFELSYDWIVQSLNLRIKVHINVDLIQVRQV